ncbi:MAG: hypothetical protein IKK21_07650 [Clostridia bacterium]|nr:hypothetical protein [Clostridia bacterium]
MNQPHNIVPGRSIGEFCLHESREDVLSKISGKYTKEHRVGCDVYHLQHVSIWIDREKNQVDQITAREGFPGSFQDAITIGSKFRELKALGNVYCENDHVPVYMIEGIDGICFEMEDDDIDEEFCEDEQRIGWISVFDDAD